MRVIVLLLAVVAPVSAQSRPVLDSLVARIAGGWVAAPCKVDCVRWTVVHGDSTALQASKAEINGSARSGNYTVTMRPGRFAAPVLIGRLRVGHERVHVVANRRISRGEILDTTSIALQRTVVWGAPTDTAASEMRAMLGTETRRTLSRGEVVRSSDVIDAPVVFAGDTVTAEFIRDGVRLALVGTALQNASLGARVAIRLDRGRRFAGVATGRHTVRLDR